MSEESHLAVIGASVPRLGFVDKIRGQARYTADLKRPGMLYGAVLRSPHAHARIVNIDSSEAAQQPGVQAILTYRDVPAVRLDADLLPLDQTVRFVGDEVALVAAESEALAQDAARLIRVEYEVLPAVFDPEAALRPGAPAVHPQGNLVGGKTLVVERGSVDQGFAEATRVFEGHLQYPDPCSGWHGDPRRPGRVAGRPADGLEDQPGRACLGSPDPGACAWHGARQRAGAVHQYGRGFWQ